MIPFVKRRRMSAVIITPPMISVSILEWEILILWLKFCCRDALGLWCRRWCRRWCRCCSLDSLGLDIHQVNIVVPSTIVLPCID